MIKKRILFISRVNWIEVIFARSCRPNQHHFIDEDFKISHYVIGFNALDNASVELYQSSVPTAVHNLSLSEKVFDTEPDLIVVLGGDGNAKCRCAYALLFRIHCR